MVTKVMYLDLKDPSVVPEIHVPRGDSGLRAFEFHLLDGSSIYTIPTNVTITIRGTKPDKNGFTYPCTYTSSTGVVVANCTEQMTAVVGDTICQLVLVDTNSNRIATFCFHLIVERSATDDGTIYSDSDMAYAEQIVNRIQSDGTLQFINYASETIVLNSVGYGS